VGEAKNPTPGSRRGNYGLGTTATPGVPLAGSAADDAEYPVQSAPRHHCPIRIDSAFPGDYNAIRTIASIDWASGVDTGPGRAQAIREDAGAGVVGVVGIHYVAGRTATPSGGAPVSMEPSNLHMWNGYSSDTADDFRTVAVAVAAAAANGRTWQHPQRSASRGAEPVLEPCTTASMGMACYTYSDRRKKRLGM